MRRPPQRATRTYTLIPDATLVRSTSGRASPGGARYQYPMSFGDAEILVRATPTQDGIPREGVVDPIVDQSFVDVDRDDLPKDHPGVEFNASSRFQLDDLGDPTFERHRTLRDARSHDDPACLRRQVACGKFIFAVRTSRTGRSHPPGQPPRTTVPTQDP